MGIFVFFCKIVKNFYVDLFDYSINICMFDEVYEFNLKFLVLFYVINFFVL